MSADQLVELAEQWKQRAEADREKLERMESCARSALCRWQVLHTYFVGEPGDEPAAQKEADTETELDVGDRVTLPKYGVGKVTAVDG